jgi:hypothetical protein
VKGRLAAAGCLALLAPVTLLVLNRTLGSASVDRAPDSGGMAPSFVGDHLVTAPNTPSFGDLAVSSSAALDLAPNSMTLVWLAPQLLLLAAGFIATRQVVRARSIATDPRVRARLAVLLAMAWLPPAVVWLGASVPRARYLLHVHAIGWVVLALLLDTVLRRGAVWLRGGPGTFSWRDAGVLLLALSVLASGLGWRLQHPVVQPDYAEALEYVASRRAPDQPVIVALPAIAYLTPGADTGLIFLAGPAERPRADHLTRHTEDGRTTDFWLGVPAIDSVEELRLVLALHPDAWIVVDAARLRADWAYAGPFAEVLQRETMRVYDGTGDVLVLRPLASRVALPQGIRPM